MKRTLINILSPKDKGFGPRQERISLFIDLRIWRRGLDKHLAEIPGKIEKKAKIRF